MKILFQLSQSLLFIFLNENTKAQIELTVSPSFRQACPYSRKVFNFNLCFSSSFDRNAQTMFNFNHCLCSPKHPTKLNQGGG